MKKLLLITGDLACGKTTFAKLLSKRYDTNLYFKDSLKELLGDTIGFSNREENLKLSKAAVQVMAHIFSEFAPLGKNLILEANFRTHELEKLHAIDVGAVRMVHFSDVSKDEQAWANDYLEHVQFPDGMSGVMPTSPLEMESVGKIVTKPAPMVGHDTVAVLQDLGYSDDEIARMNDSGAIYSEK